LAAIYSLSAEKPLARAVGDIRWQALADWASVLLTPQGLPLDEWLREGAAHVVKRGEHRSVYHVELSNRAFYVKHYHSPGTLGALRHLFRPSAARREWIKAVEIGRRGVPTITPVALGEQFRAGLVHDSFLVTAALSGTVTLDNYVAQALPQLGGRDQVRRRRELIAAVAKLCATAHRAGVDHNDFHSGNILVQCGSDGALGLDQAALSLYLIDVPGVRLGGPLNWEQSRVSLIALHAAWRGQLTAGQRRRFVRIYLAARADLQIGPAAAEAEIVERTWEYAWRVMRGRDRRAALTNRDFYRLATRHGVAHAVRELSTAELAEVLADPESLIRRNLDRPMKLSHSSVVVEAQLNVGRVPTPVAYKRCRRKTWSKRLAALLVPSRAWRSWYFGHALRARGIATPRPILVCQPRGVCPRDSYLATEWIAGASDLHLYGWDLARRGLDERHRRARQVADALGRLIGRLHAWNISHRDLKALNLLVVEHADRVECWLIDLDAIRFCRKLTSVARANDLARLAVSLAAHPWATRTLRMRFLRAYMEELPPALSDRQEFSRQVAAREARIARRQSRKGQPNV
jgi:tRNA A-37 threonylcarbamoyl transferase component Bud32